MMTSLLAIGWLALGQESVPAVAQGLKVNVKVVGPAEASADLSVACLFERERGSKGMVGGILDLDQKLGGLLTDLRRRGRFSGHEMETLVLDVPKGKLGSRRILVIGMGDPATADLARIRRAGQTALREAIRLGAKSVAYASDVKDAGVTTLETGAVATTLVNGIQEAYGTEITLQSRGLSPKRRLSSWTFDAGKAYFDVTSKAVAAAVRSNVRASVSRPSSRAWSTRPPSPGGPDTSR